MPPFDDKKNTSWPDEPEQKAQLYKASPLFIEKRYEDTKEAASAYISTLHNLLQCLDLTTPLGASKAHGIINMIEQVQKMQAALVNPEPSREERKDAFGRR